MFVELNKGANKLPISSRKNLFTSEGLGYFLKRYFSDNDRIDSVFFEADFGAHKHRPSSQSAYISGELLQPDCLGWPDYIILL